MSSRPRSIRHSAVVLALAALAAAGCGMPPTGLDDIDLCPGGPDKVGRMQLTPKTVNLRVGSTETLRLEMYDRNGEWILLCSPSVAWSSSDPSIATVSNGLVSGIGAGKV